MEYRKHIEKAIEFMENHLQDKLSVHTCARACGYSEYHFMQIFKLVVGLSPMDYVRKRRLSEAAKGLQETTMPLLDIALEWGFESAENFLRAFKTEHGVTPGAYRRQKNSLHLLEAFQGIAGSITEIEPQLVELSAFTLCGYPSKMKISEKHYEIPRAWNRYHIQQLGKALDPCTPPEERVDIGFTEFLSEDECRYIIGVADLKEIPEGAIEIHFPDGLYGVFETPKADAFTFVERIHDTWNHIFGSWLGTSNYELANGFAYETYCEESRIYQEKIYIPLRKKGGF